MNDYKSLTTAQRRYFDSGATRSKQFRHDQLQKLKDVILQNEQKFYDALREDLNKPPEEAWVTEIGFVIAEIRLAMKNLGKWMRPERVPTNLLNFPSTSFIHKEPLGVVLIIGPWNYPLHLVFAPLVGAIAAGNCIMLKPSELAPATTSLISTIVKEIFPQEYISCVEGDGRVVVTELLNAFRFDHIFYTGSTAVGKQVYQLAAAQLIPVTLELGGKSPCVVEDDANIRVAAKRIAQTKFSNAGQMCVAPDYVLVHESVHDQLVNELKARITEFYGEENDGAFAKIVNAGEVDRLSGYIQNGSLIVGGEIDQKKGMIGPTLIADVSADSPVMKQEIFGPILPVLSFKTFEEAKAVVEKNPDPLAFYVFTESSDKAKRWIKEVRFGGGCINNAAWHLTNPNLPFGGRGNSGIGAYHGKYSFDVFSHKKSIMKTPAWFDPRIKYPPFKGKLNLIKKFIG